ncbi:putative Ig domain-containing protein, partial [Pontibacter sp. BT731]|uniref:putative Ig domain-containing protein n=1 Tax=Pontibacter coccineus TaxID=3063328 RepID=UPI0026E2A545
KFDGQGAFLFQFGSEGSGEGQLSHPNGLTVDGQGNVYVADRFNHRVQKFDGQGAFLFQFGSEGSGEGQLSHPYGIAVDGQGNVYVADQFNHRVVVFGLINVQNTAPILTVIGNKLVNEQSYLTFQASAIDDDLPNNSLTYSLADPETGTYPTGASITETGTFSWTSTEAQGPGTFRVKVVVSDGEMTDEEEIGIQVNEVNVAPVLANIGNKQVVMDSNLSFTVSAIDSDIPSQNLSYSTSRLPAGATFNASTRTFSWTPKVNQTGDYTITFQVSDGEFADNEVVNIKVVKSTALKPSISSISPTSGPIGTVITILGNNLGSGVLEVRFNGLNAVFKPIDETTVRAVVPENATSGKITVITFDGSATSKQNFTVTSSNPTPTISKFSPNSGAVGTSVIITGTNFTGATTVAFKGTSATFNVLSNTSIRANVPLGAITGPISVTTPGGTGTSKQNFRVTGTSTTAALQVSEITDAFFETYPNPFSGITTIAFSLENGESYTLEVFDLRGALVRRVATGIAEANKLYEFRLIADGLAEGIYITRLTTPSRVQSIKAVLKR